MVQARWIGAAKLGSEGIVTQFRGAVEEAMRYDDDGERGFGGAVVAWASGSPLAVSGPAAGSARSGRRAGAAISAAA